MAEVRRERPCSRWGGRRRSFAELYKHNLIEYAYIDGMARKATEITMRYPEAITNENLLAQAMRKITWVGKELNRGDATNSPGIIVTTAGMLNGGPVLDYILNSNDRSKIFLTGYQVEGTNGRRLTEGKPLMIDGEKHQIKTPWVYYDFSAHSGKTDDYKFVKQCDPETVICMHGDKAVAEGFAEPEDGKGFKAHAPRMGDTR